MGDKKNTILCWQKKNMTKNHFLHKKIENKKLTSTSNAQ